MSTSPVQATFRKCEERTRRTNKCLKWVNFAEESDVQAAVHKINQIQERMNKMENGPVLSLEQINLIKEELEEHIYILFKKFQESEND